MAVSVDFSRFAPLLGEETVQAAQAPFQTSAFPKVRIYPTGRAISSSGRSAVCPRSVSFRVECRAAAFSSVTARYGYHRLYFFSGTNIRPKLMESNAQQLQMALYPTAAVRMLPSPAPTPKTRMTPK